MSFVKSRKIRANKAITYGSFYDPRMTREATNNEGFNIEPYINLGNAIIAQAYKDYISLAFASPGTIITQNGKIVREIHENNSVLDASVNVGEIKKFLNSTLYSSITTMPPEVLLEKADREISIIKDSIKNGRIWDQFVMLNPEELYSINKYDYNRFAKDTRKRHAILSLIDRFEKKIQKDCDFHNKEMQVYRVLNIKTNPQVDKTFASSKVIYIAPNHKMHFYAFDHDEHNYYKIFDKRCIKKKREYLKK